MKSIVVDSLKNKHKNQDLEPWAKIYRTRPRTGRKYRAVLEPEPEPPDIPSQFCTRNRNRKKYWTIKTPTWSLQTVLVLEILKRDTLIEKLFT